MQLLVSRAVRTRGAKGVESTVRRIPPAMTTNNSSNGVQAIACELRSHNSHIGSISAFHCLDSSPNQCACPKLKTWRGEWCALVGEGNDSPQMCDGSRRPFFLALDRHPVAHGNKTETSENETGGSMAANLLSVAVERNSTSRSSPLTSLHPDKLILGPRLSPSCQFSFTNYVADRMSQTRTFE
jgi:hypothetical protein